MSQKINIWDNRLLIQWIQSKKKIIKGLERVKKKSFTNVTDVN